MPRKTPVESSERLNRALGLSGPTKPRLRKPSNGNKPSSDDLVAASLGKWKPHAENPRKITDEQLEALKLALKEFGDLSGLVFNRKTGNTVGGHQRVKVLGDAPVRITTRFAEPTKVGTVAEGYVTYEGERFVYREVEWIPEKEKAAMIAANKHGGDWDFPKLSDLLLELDSANFDLQLTGFNAAELEKMVTRLQVTDKDETAPLSAEDIAALPAHVRMVQLFLSTDTLPPFMEKIKVLGETYATANITDTVLKAVEECYSRSNGNNPSTSSEKAAAKTTDTGLPAKERRTAKGRAAKKSRA